MKLYGTLWYEMEWNGTELHGMTWCSMARFDVMKCCVGVVMWYRMVLYEYTVWFSVTY